MASLLGFVPSASIEINGREMKVEGVDPQSGVVTLLGDDVNVMRKGLNVIGSGLDQVTYFWEERRLRKFATPYPTSFAIIAAIDDYQRTKHYRNSDQRGWMTFRTWSSGAKN